MNSNESKREHIRKLIMESQIEGFENSKRAMSNMTKKIKDMEPLQSKAFLELVDAVIEYLE